MIRRFQIEDPAPLQGACEGDLKYGRRNGFTAKPGKDFPANRDKNGVPTNKPVFGIVPRFKRDPQMWKREGKVPEKQSIAPGENLLGDLLLYTLDRDARLCHNISRIRKQSH